MHGLSSAFNRGGVDSRIIDEMIFNALDIIIHIKDIGGGKKVMDISLVADSTGSLQSLYRYDITEKKFAVKFDVGNRSLEK